MHKCPFLQWLMSIGYKYSYFFLPRTMNTGMGQFADHLDIFKQWLYVIEKISENTHCIINSTQDIVRNLPSAPSTPQMSHLWLCFYRGVCMCLKQILCSWMGYKGYAHITVWKYRTNCFVHLHYDDMHYMRSDVFAICL